MSSYKAEEHEKAYLAVWKGYCVKFRGTCSLHSLLGFELVITRILGFIVSCPCYLACISSKPNSYQYSKLIIYDIYYLKIMDKKFKHFLDCVANFFFWILNRSNVNHNVNRCETLSIDAINCLNSLCTYVRMCEVIFLRYPFPRRDTTLGISQLCIFKTK